MAGIAPIPGSIPNISSVGMTRKAIPSKADGQTQFAQTLNDCFSKVNTEQQSATDAVADLVSGKTGDILPAVTAVANADLSFKLLVGVRNKVIEAYKQTMNMQI